MAEKRFHDNAVRDAMGKGNATWVKERRERFEEEIRLFYVSSFFVEGVDTKDRRY
jgi:hypothetical protein